MKSVSVTATFWDHTESRVFTGNAGYTLDTAGQPDHSFARFWGGGKTLVIPRHTIIAIEVEE